MKVITALLCVILCSTLLNGQKNFIKLEISPNKTHVGESITVSVKSNIKGNISVTYPSQFKHGYNVMTGMSEEYDNVSGKINRISYMSETGKIDQAGTYTFGPALIRSGGKTFKSNTVNVIVKPFNQAPTPGEKNTINAQQLKQPAFGVIEQSKKEIYAGEAVLLNARIYSQINPSQLENYKSFSFEGAAEKYQLSDMNDQITVTDTRLKNTYYYTFSCDKQVVFPSGNGNFRIKPFELSLFSGFESLDITSTPANIKINPLPQPSPDAFTGIVGKLAVSTNLVASTYKQGSVIQVKLIFTGTGNMQQIHVPKLNLPKQFNLYGDPISKEDIQYSESGANGTVIYTYNIQCLEAGNQTIPVQKFSYFDPIKKSYVTLQSGPINLSIDADPAFAAQQKKGTTSTMTLREDSTITPDQSTFWNTLAIWTGIIILILLTTLFSIHYKPWKLIRITPKVNKETTALSSVNEKPRLEINILESILSTNNTAQFYTQLDKISKQFLCDHLELPQTSTLTEILHQLDVKGLTNEQLDTIKSFFNDLDQARFFVGSEADPRHFLTRLQSISDYFTN